ncbi:SipW-dependent-type signal peptide-containing protein [Agromyces atrinae]|uniref:Acyl-CoA dehydrogenase n=1 Tax=Agromyces atrinae TaxID=592376 RepID=A0A4Q2M727_9MICO|nr:SipW-dependent-type signal peptide-containing protein [Agromyces atrinae]NYD68726.1 putative ribosomally synthesized peptide with SipW-like signal peptide [Agromyces atrinae]RXZ86083.1 acyl-CoA dehydrogenase [Agromyces atrinae]
MTSHRSTGPRRDSTTRRRVFAIAAGGAVLGLGVTATLAAWTDTEWVFGGDGTGGPGIGTSTFEILQNTVAPFDDPADWVNEDANPGGEITFGVDALALSPGVSVYAAVALQTSDSSLAGDVLLQSAVPAAGIAQDDPGDLLYDALEVRVATDDALFDCDLTAFSGAPGAPGVIADGPLATTGGAAEQSLLALAGSTQYYCFEVTLPAGFTPAPGSTLDDYMGRTFAPAWVFDGETA